jgi:hypothetical protein
MVASLAIPPARYSSISVPDASVALVAGSLVPIGYSSQWVDLAIVFKPKQSPNPLNL